MYAPLDCHWHFCTISTATSGPIVWPTCGMFAGEMETGGGLFSLVLQCIHNHIWVMSWYDGHYLLTCLTFGVDLETISTPLCHNCGPVSLHQHFPVMSVFSHVSCQFILFHILPDVVNPSSSDTVSTQTWVLYTGLFLELSFSNSGGVHDS